MTWGCEGGGGGPFTAPTVANFKAQFFRDFPYGGASGDPGSSVLDQDITNAFNLVDNKINPGLFGNQGQYGLAYLYLAAHFLVLNLRASSQGLNGQWNWAQNNKAAGGVSEGFEIPERIKNNPELMIYSKTNYGLLYLDMVLPYLEGQMFTVAGTTKP